MQPLLAARVPHRPPLDDRRHGGANRGCSAGTLEGDRPRVDTRTKILTPAALAAPNPPRPTLLAAGRFDDHRSMTAVTVERTSAVALELWKETAPAWTPALKS
jgi:hypothetical protein